MMKKINKICLALALVLLMLTLTACGKSSFGLTENTEKHMTITAERADAGSFFMGGTLEVAEGEQIVLSAAMTKGSVKVEIVPAPEEQSIDSFPDMDGEAIITAIFESSESASGTLAAGSYLVRATSLAKATGVIEIEVKPAA